MNKKGALTDMFLFLIISFIIVIVCGLFIFIGTTTSNELHNKLDNMSTQEVNYTHILQQSMDKVPTSYHVLRWGSFVLIAGMILSIIFGSYLVTTKPIYFVPYLLILMLAVMLSAVMANVYEDNFLNNPMLGVYYQQFVMTNFVMLYLPLVVSVVGILGAIVMFASYKMGSTQ